MIMGGRAGALPTFAIVVALGTAGSGRAAAQQRDTTAADTARTVPVRADTTRADTTRTDTTRVDTTVAQILAPTVVTGTRLSTVDERTPVQVDEIRLEKIPLGPVGAADALARLPGVSVFDDQGTRAQPTLEIRGFRISPVVGVSQGVSVFLDGVRINEPDAQELNFDLIPMDAIDKAELVRGPGTLYGKNALAGALVLTTKRGTFTPELSAAFEAGDFGYIGGRVSAGGVIDDVDGYIMARGTEEDGYRDQTPARTRQLFVNVGRKGTNTDLAMTLMYAHDRIFQAGSLPESWLRVDRRANFTGGDFFDPELWHIAVRGERPLYGGTIRANAFRRDNDYQQFNVNVDAPSTDAHVDNTSKGGTLEWTLPTSISGMPLGLTIGAEYSRNDITYRIFSVPTTSAPEFEDECDQSNGLCEDARVKEDDAALYAQGVLSLTPALAVTASMRGDYVRIPFRDLREPENDGTSTYRRFSPRLGVNYYISPELRGYAAVSTGFRAPAPLELACASESSPCSLPFALGDDPPLHPATVVNYESGIDWEPHEGTNLDIVGFREDARNEIVFVASSTTRGFFQNIRRVRREGIEASGSLTLPAGFRLFGSYALIDATYQSPVLLASELPEPDSARPGNRLPLSPRHRSSVGIEFRSVVGTSLLDAQLSLRAVSRQYLQGNDENLDEVNLSPGVGAGRVVSGSVPGYTVTNLQLRYERPHLALAAHVQNLFDRHFETFGIFGENPVGPIGGPRPPEPVLERFLNPGYPRNLSISVELSR
ncbi:MAG TPA: TonB-dependent receptor [Gemmatimonadaceae bacterium]|nr:TonB-dependent receptor [Gemmatimonadaceae bacterium]